jgi:hypothetical protein
MTRVPYYYYCLSLVGFMLNEAELRGLKLFMANVFYRIKQCGALALTKDSLLFVSLAYKLISDCVSTNQLFVVHLVLYRLYRLAPVSPNVIVDIVVLVWLGSSVRCSRRLFT